MSYDEWLSTPPDDRHDWPGRSYQRPSFRCFDCGAVGEEGYISDPSLQRIYCHGCGRSRAKRALLSIVSEVA